VLVWHYVHAQLQGVTPGTMLAFLKQAVSFTWYGVNLFFVRSGFLIAGILLDHRETGSVWSRLWREDRDLFNRYIPDDIHPLAEGNDRVTLLLLVDALGFT